MTNDERAYLEALIAVCEETQRIVGLFGGHDHDAALHFIHDLMNVPEGNARLCWQSKIDGHYGESIWIRACNPLDKTLAYLQKNNPNYDYWMEYKPYADEVK